MSRFAPTACPRLVVKVGSALLVDPSGLIRTDWLGKLVVAIADRLSQGQQIVIVSSGAIALGARRLGLAKGGRATLEDAQAAAATGQIALSSAWADALAANHCTAAQMLVTLDDLEDRRRYLNVAATLNRLLRLGVVPVVNENDSVATAEIRFGDNDRLAARIAGAACASGVVLLSDVDGLYDADPTLHADARHIPMVTSIDAAIVAMAGGGSTSGMGTGGMASKIAAARIATSAGAHLVIVSGHADDPLAALEGGTATVFVADASAPARKAWLAGGLTARGVVHIDAGAVIALRDGRSLLAAGVTGIEGSFGRGDLVAIAGPAGTIARGLAEYDVADATLIAGTRREDQAAILGYAPRAALIHRNHLAML